MAYIQTKSGVKVLLDPEDKAAIERFGFSIWIMKRGGYPAVTIDGKNIPLHGLLVRRAGGKVVDHINRNPLDNRRANLRLCFQYQNTWNGGAHKDSKSGVRGVCKKGNKWTAYISKHVARGGKQITLGYFSSFEEAVAARKAAEKKFYKLFAPV